jgi:hypothetical protein
LSSVTHNGNRFSIRFKLKSSLAALRYFCARHFSSRFPPGIRRLYRPARAKPGRCRSSSRSFGLPHFGTPVVGQFPITTLIGT